MAASSHIAFVHIPSLEHHVDPQSMLMEDLRVG